MPYDKYVLKEAAHRFVGDFDSPAHYRRKQWGLAAAATLVAWLTVEIALWYLAPIGDPFITHDPNLRITLKPNSLIMPNVTSPSVFTTDAQGFRVTHPITYSRKPANVRRVFLVGGSTTEGFYIDDTRTFGYLLERRLNRDIESDGMQVEIVNAGRGGTGSADHYYLAWQLVAYSPDVIVYLMGVNDMIGYLRTRFQPRASGVKAMIRYTVRRSQFARRLLFIYRRASAEEQVVRDVGGENLVSARQRRRERPVVPMPEDAKTVPDSFRHNVGLIVELHRRHGIKGVFMTQPTLWHREMSPDLDRLLYNTPNALPVQYSAAELDALMERYNDVLRTAVVSEPQLRLLDLARILPKDTSVFYDDEHFNDQGHQRIAELLARTLLNEGLLISDSGPRIR